MAVFAEDVAVRRYAEQAGNIMHSTDFDTGGHFAAPETPDLLIQDIRAFFASPLLTPPAAAAGCPHLAATTHSCHRVTAAVVAPPPGEIAPVLTRS